MAIGILGYLAPQTPVAPIRPIEAVAVELHGSGAGMATGAPSPNATVVEIRPGATTTSFTVEEILGGEANSVIGTTDQSRGPDRPRRARAEQHAGRHDPHQRADPATDEAQRNRMLRQFILATDQFEYNAFAPVTITGLPASVPPSIAYPMQIDGKLTIKDVTRDVSFSASITPVSMTQLQEAPAR
jgi:hypothetical protein